MSKNQKLKKPKKIGVFVPDWLHREFKSKCSTNGAMMQDVLANFVFKYCGKEVTNENKKSNSREHPKN